MDRREASDSTRLSTAKGLGSQNQLARKSPQRNSNGSLYSLGTSASSFSIANLAARKASMGSKGNLSVSKDLTLTGAFQPLSIKETSHVIFCVKFSPLGDYLAVSLQDGSIDIYSVADDKYLYSLHDEKLSGNLPATSIAFRPLNHKLVDKSILSATYSSGKIVHFHYTAKKVVAVNEEAENQINCISYDPAGLQYVTVGSDCHVRVYDSRSFALKYDGIHGKRQVSSGHSNMVFAAKFHPKDPNILITAGWDNTIQVWDMKYPHSVRSIYGPHICGESVEFTADGSSLITASHTKEDNLTVWSFETGEKTASIVWNRMKTMARYCPLYSLKYLHAKTRETLAKQLGKEYTAVPVDSLIIAGGGTGDLSTGSNEVRIYNLSSKQCIGSVLNIPGTVHSIDVHPLRNLVVFGGSGKELYLGELNALTEEHVI